MPRKQRRAAKKPKTIAERKIEYSSSPNRVMLYANHVGLHFTNFEAKITFGLIKDADPEKISVELVGDVFLTHGVFQRLRELLSKMNWPQIEVEGTPEAP